MSSVRLAVRAVARAVAIATCCGMLPWAGAVAQDTSSTPNLRPTPDSQLVVLRLRDGSSLIGRVLEVTPLVVRFASAVGESAIPRDAIREVRSMAATRAHDGE